MKFMATAFITHADCARHDMGRHHPESPARLAAIEDHLISSGLAGLLERHDAPAAKVSELARVHPIEYIEAIREASRIASMYSIGCTRASSLTLAAGASWRSSSPARPEEMRWSSIAASRAGLSGWWRPMSCLAQSACVINAVAMNFIPSSNHNGFPVNLRL